MTNARIVVGDVKAGRCFQKELDISPLIGKKIGEKIHGDSLGLEGYELEITGGSDTAGFPMRKDLPGSAKRKLLVIRGMGARTEGKGKRVKKTFTGHTISENLSQVNVKVIKYGNKSVYECLGVEVKPTKKEQRAADKKAKAEVKQEA